MAQLDRLILALDDAESAALRLLDCVRVAKPLAPLVAAEAAMRVRSSTDLPVASQVFRREFAEKSHPQSVVSSSPTIPKRSSTDLPVASQVTRREFAETLSASKSSLGPLRHHRPQPRRLEEGLGRNPSASMRTVRSDQFPARAPSTSARISSSSPVAGTPSKTVPWRSTTGPVFGAVTGVLSGSVSIGSASTRKSGGTREDVEDNALVRDVKEDVSVRVHVRPDDSLFDPLHLDAASERSKTSMWLTSAPVEPVRRRSSSLTADSLQLVATPAQQVGASGPLLLGSIHGAQDKGTTCDDDVGLAANSAPIATLSMRDDVISPEMDNDAPAHKRLTQLVEEQELALLQLLGALQNI